MRRFLDTFLLLSGLLLAGIISAQQASTTSVPNLIRYGGTLKEANGAPVAATAGVTFAIYKQQDGGAPVWMETQNVTTDAGGNYSVLLGSTTATGLPSELFSEEEQRWLGVQVQGQAEQPRVLLVSVPYAFKAHEAETLAGKNISDFVLAKDLNASPTAVGAGSSQAASSVSSSATKPGIKTAAASAGPTNFSGATADQIVKVTQTGAGYGINATTSSANYTNAVVGTIPGAGVAIFGHASTSSAQGYGIEGVSESTIGVGLLGFARAATGSTYGLKGYSSSTGGTGVRGLSTATTGVTYGVSGAVSSATGTAMWGQATATNGGTGVWGQSLATTGAAVGVRGESASNSGVGVYGINSSTSGSTYGVKGADDSPSGVGVLGTNSANGGTGVYGKATAIGGLTTGVLGVAASPDGTGVSGEGPMIGVTGVAGNANGAGGVFVNTSSQTGAKILIAGDSEGTSRFSVDTSGNVSVTIGTTSPVTVSLPVNHARLSVGGGTHSYTLYWAFPFSDTNYTVTCTSQIHTGACLGDCPLLAITSLAADSFVLEVNANEDPPQSVDVHCLGVHD